MGKVECGSEPGLESQGLGPVCNSTVKYHPCVSHSENAFSEPICQS